MYPEPSVDQQPRSLPHESHLLSKLGKQDRLTSGEANTFNIVAAGQRGAKTSNPRDLNLRRYCRDSLSSHGSGSPAVGGHECI